MGITVIRVIRAIRLIRLIRVIRVIRVIRRVSGLGLLGIEDPAGRNSVVHEPTWNRTCESKIGLRVRGLGFRV